ncbi:PREDICTED: hydroxyacyl-thioester dehydratase type 2, mitochondrial-like [Ceratosolen solmsi marchali]|uniref:Hydroxyacyl-thioester dehydratase type 2, mitochondrial-like n=1 Tax=Ceratosolen solmsi marchali TaxID=326594 RepID=A0AAJ7E068_9HYME|nr:PREDICTED: hydroxyacyl-thioester dehydratase type 2, mitochondrial-like [Ceratosolen solmsi marchali]
MRKPKIFHTMLASAKKYCTKVSSSSNVNKNLENLKIGNRVSIQRTVTEDDVLRFIKLSNDYNPIHINCAKNIVHGAFLNSLLSGIIGTKLPGPGTVIIEQILKYPNPCYVGDTVEISVEIISVRKMVKCKYTCIANSERIVMEGEAKLITNSNITKKIILMK